MSDTKNNNNTNDKNISNDLGISDISHLSDLGDFDNNVIEETLEENDNDIEENDKLVYLGSGTFGIIQERNSGKNSKLFVRKRINYENRKVKKIDNDADPEEEELFNVW